MCKFDFATSVVNIVVFDAVLNWSFILHFLNNVTTHFKFVKQIDAKALGKRIEIGLWLNHTGSKLFSPTNDFVFISI